jgi:acyl carrier protein/GNAT superfamily N-acetyltransferase
LGDREIKVDAPLGELGLGLDSLAFLRFITDLENRFEVEIPEETWIDRGQLTLTKLADIIKTEAPTIPETPATTSVESQPEIEVTSRGLAKLPAVIRDRGLVGGLFWAGHRTFAAGGRAIWEREDFHILVFDLEKQPLPQVPLPKRLTLRLGSAKDLPATDGLWPVGQTKEKQRLMIDRLRRGYLCYTAWMDERIVAMDWVTASDDDEPGTGLLVSPQPGSCVGLDLNEHPNYVGRGVGLATLAWSLEHSRESGLKRQFTIVQSTNEKMLRTSIGLLGFKKVGELITTRKFRRPSSVWHLHGVDGSGRRLCLF